MIENYRLYGEAGWVIDPGRNNMGVRSTKTITRTEAIKAIQSHLPSITNDEVSDILLSMFGEKDIFSNYWVKDDNCDDETDIDSNHFEWLED